MSRALAAVFVLALATFFALLPAVVLAWTDAVTAWTTAEAATGAVVAAATAELSGVVYLLRVPEPLPARRSDAPRRPDRVLEPRTFRIIVRVTVSALGVAALFGATAGIVGLLDVIGR